MLAYPAKFTPEGKGFVVTFPDIPEAITEGDSAQEAMEYAVDALETVLSVYIKEEKGNTGARKSSRQAHAPGLPARAQRGEGLALSRHARRRVR